MTAVDSARSRRLRTISVTEDDVCRRWSDNLQAGLQPLGIAVDLPEMVTFPERAVDAALQYA